MRVWMLCLMLGLTPLCGLSRQNSQENKPLTADEKRQILRQLVELESARVEIETYKAFVEREAAQDERERANAARALDLEKQATQLAQRERDLALERASMYENLWKVATKKRGTGCTVARIFTLGIYRCK